MKANFKAIKIYPKLVLSFLLIVVPICVTSLFMNQSEQEVVKTSISESLSSRVHFYISSLETEVNRLKKLTVEYMNDDDFIKLSMMADTLSNFERTESILEVKNKLYLLKTSSPFVENVGVYIPLLNRGINANNFDDIIPGDELKFILMPVNMKSPIFSIKEKLMMSSLYPNIIYLNQKPRLALTVEISRSELTRTLSNIVNYDKGGALLYNRSWNVLSDRRDPVLPEINKMFLGFGENAEKSGLMQIKQDGKSYSIAYEYSSTLDATIAIYVPMESMLKPLKKFKEWIWLFSFIASFLIAIFSYWIFRIIHVPLHRLLIAFKKVEGGNMDVQVHHHNQDEFNYLYEQFNLMVSKIKVLIHEVYEQQIRSQKSELKQLQSQINPHFFYNSFFVLKSLVNIGEYELVDKMLYHLGSYFQFITRNGEEGIPLEAEVKHAVSYVEIQSMRFSETITVDFALLPESWAKVTVPRLILQPIIENAFLHGLEKKVDGGLLIVAFQDEGNVLSINVEDNGDNLSDEQLTHLQSLIDLSKNPMETTGILNVHRRLQLKFGSEYGLTVTRSILGGLKVRIKIIDEEGLDNV